MSGLVSEALGAAETATTGMTIGGWIKLGLGAAAVLILAGLIWYAHHEKVVADQLQEKVGTLTQQVADRDQQIKVDESAIKLWQAALNKYQKNAQAQAKKTAALQKQKDEFDAQVRALLSQLDTDPMGTVTQLNGHSDVLLCMLNNATGGSQQCATPASSTAGAP